MASISSKVVKLLVRRNIKKEPQSQDHLVKHLRRNFNNNAALYWIPRGVTRKHFRINQVSGHQLKVAKPQLAILYLHGGGYISGTPRNYLTLCGRFAKALSANVYLPRYRLAPEHPFPAPVDDAFAVYQGLLAEMPAENIVVIGDSAGGGLGLALLLKLRDEGIPLPRCGVAYSPMADMSAPPGSRFDNHESCSMFTSSMFTIAPNIYVRSDEHMKHPYASPVYGEFSGLPPLLLTVDEDETLRDDTHRVAEQARMAGVSVKLIARHGLMHVWPVFYPLLAESRKDVAFTIKFIKSLGN